MKNILYLLSLALILVGCEKYELPSDPQLNLNGWWDVIEVKLVIDEVNSDKQVMVSQEEQATVGNYIIVGPNSDGYVTLTNNFSGTDIEKRFDVNWTQWEFDYGILRITDSLGDIYTNVTFPCNYCTEYTVIEIGGLPENRYTFSIDTYGAMPSNQLKISSNPFVTEYITSHLEITLHRI